MTPLALFLTGEKGLVEAMDGSVLTAWDLEINCFGCRLGGVDGCVLALFSFLYSLYFSAEETLLVSGVHGINCQVRTAPISGRSLMSWMVGSRP